MPNHVCMGALLQCSFGVAPSSLVVLPVNKMLTSFVPAANIMDHKPMVNIMPFGMCSSPANPAVAVGDGGGARRADAHALHSEHHRRRGCPGAPTVLLANQPVLDDTSTLMCMWGGVIKVNFAGQATEQVP